MMSRSVSASNTKNFIILTNKQISVFNNLPAKQDFERLAIENKKWIFY